MAIFARSLGWTTVLRFLLSRLPGWPLPFHVASRFRSLFSFQVLGEQGEEGDCLLYEFWSRNIPEKTVIIEIRA